MAWGFRKRTWLLGGLVHLNLSKHGLGASVGVPGLRLGVDSQRHSYVRGGLPGTGLFFTEHIPHHVHHTHAQEPKAGFWACAVMAVFVVVWIFMVYAGQSR